MAEPAKTDLIRGLSVTDATLITVGAVLGTGAFLTTSDVARDHGSVAGVYAVVLVEGVIRTGDALSLVD